MSVQKIACPSCGASQLERTPEGKLRCTYCGNQFALGREEFPCPACGTPNPSDAMRCMSCGLKLGQVCPVCNHDNPPGMEYCLNCTSPLDMLSAVLSRGGGRQSGNTVMKEKLVAAKREDMIFMQTQRAQLEAEERA